MVLDPSLLASLAQDTAAAVSWLTGIKTPEDRLDTALRFFESLNERSATRAMDRWTSDGTYDDPDRGGVAIGMQQVRQAVDDLVAKLTATNQKFAVDRVTGGRFNVIVEWRLTPADGRRGVHVVDLDEDARIKRITVYARST